MKLRVPYLGVELDVPEEIAPRYKARGFEEVKPPKKSSRPTKAELLEQVEAECTNPELVEAVDKAKKSPTKPKRKKA